MKRLQETRARRAAQVGILLLLTSGAGWSRPAKANLLGFPTEQWGVSNNVRPTMRAPRFDEAAFAIGAEPTSATIDIRVAK